ncbi:MULTISPECIES: glycine--tRNA ligase subunit beta [unclassified Halanaerobium]|uniref:glycine--tRNA ligase subunit beta n=1 Tax=unclassified Halanaerobium TaxID=2641197 RepID=UPI000DF281F7|nr:MULTISPECIES: glycine--tRNA ligase subunit beta [unclassified Halanaerobium]RCW45376.1 glycyl-tRNA synthetase beta chain [Halanaerobium sp. MA284_MarDTE_T2]RCW82554.1 glycyl-tRNA synthetase beta chain [Halanaerobium sp. DL-01]
MSKTLLFEIGTEEMPAETMQKFRKDYLGTALKIFDKNRIKFKNMEVYSTPRRLVLFVEDLLEKQPDKKETVRGPAANIAFDDKGFPTKAGEGFARGQGVSVEDLKEKDGYLYAEKTEKGKETADILPSLLTEIVNKVPLPKAMRWANYDIEFIRPIKWLLVLFGTQNIDLKIADVKSGNFSMGHRFLSDGRVKIIDVNNYFSKLKDAYIIVNHRKRKELILNQIDELNISGRTVIKDKLLEEVVDLVEFPTAFKGEFSKSFLKLPQEVLITVMEKHQRYFPVKDNNGKLLNQFVGVRDGGKDYLKEVISGNEMVLRGRLADAEFFFAEDKKYGFKNRLDDLKNIVFQQELGSVYDKVLKLEVMAEKIADELNWNRQDKKLLKRAARLSKNDLATEMVNEFANLQGLMGKEYALLEGEDKKTAEAILEQYMPRFAGDELPQSRIGIVLSIAEKLFNLSGHFLIDNIPSGSQDPFALRRQATGLVRIILEHDLPLDLEKMIQIGIRTVEIREDNRNKAFRELKSFIKQRLENYLTEQNIRYDVINAVINVRDNNFVDLFKRAEALMEFRNENPELFTELIRGLVRAKNISSKLEKELNINKNLLKEKEELKLYNSYREKEKEIKNYFNSSNYLKGFHKIVELKEEIDEFLDNVMVMVEDDKIKNNRLSLLKKITDLMQPVMDIDEIALDD